VKTYLWSFTFLALFLSACGKETTKEALQTAPITELEGNWLSSCENIPTLNNNKGTKQVLLVQGTNVKSFYLYFDTADCSGNHTGRSGIYQSHEYSIKVGSEIPGLPGIKEVVFDGVYFNGFKLADGKLNFLEEPGWGSLDRSKRLTKLGGVTFTRIP